jgi:UDP-3-O-[3-hydroxymyristoyl] glucosamine N-acyltransferase
VPFRLRELAARVGGRVAGDPERVLEGIRPLGTAGPTDLSFLTDAALRAQAETSAAGAILTGSETPGLRQDLLVANDPGVALLELLRLFHPEPAAAPGVHPSAVIGPGARVAPSASIGPYVVVGEDAVIGEGAVLHPFVCVGAGASVGAGAVLHPHAVLYPGAAIGARVVLHAGVVIGADGFGYIARGGRHLKVPQVGTAVLEDDVEVGANSAIDRATLDETRIGAGTKIDNLVQVGHNVRVGRSSILCGQAGIAGSATLGDGVVLAGQSGVSNRVTLGDGARVGGKASVFDDVAAGVQVAGTPAIDATRWRRQVALLQRLPELRRRLKVLENLVLGAKAGDSSADGE